MMVRSTARFSRLVLVAPLGIKLRGRDERDIADMHGIERTEYLRRGSGRADRRGDSEPARIGPRPAGY
jgi:hypothetical protein